MLRTVLAVIFLLASLYCLKLTAYNFWAASFQGPHRGEYLNRAYAFELGFVAFFVAFVVALAWRKLRALVLRIR